MVTIHVLSNSELFQYVLSALSVFLSNSAFQTLVRISVLVGIVMTTTQAISKRDPMSYVRWFVGYMIISSVVISPKTTVSIEEVGSPSTVKKVDNVPVSFAIMSSLLTSIGFGLAEQYDSLFSLPNDLTYTHSGMLFGSSVIQASTSFRILDSDVRKEMDSYFRNCIVGDMRLSKIYSANDLLNSKDLYSQVFSHTSNLRRVVMSDGETKSCREASNIIKGNVDKEIDKGYRPFGIGLFGNLSKTTETSYKMLFDRYLLPSYQFFQGQSSSSKDILRQSILVNSVHEGVQNYQASANAEAGLVNYTFSKSQNQHRFAWLVMGKKAVWFLPLLHTILLLMLFGLFPIILAMSVSTFGKQIIVGYVKLFLSIQMWPVLFSIIHCAISFYGKHQSIQHGYITIANLDRIDQLHNDLSGVAGYAMMLIPFLAKGIVSNLNEAFSSLATSMTGHVQSSSMSMANEAASGNFSIGQLSYDNVSANKHDTNFTNMHGQHKEQLSSGVIKTTNAQGDNIYSSNEAISNTVASLGTTHSIAESITKSKENAEVAATQHSYNVNKALAHAYHNGTTANESYSLDHRAGQGSAISESSSEQQAISRIMGAVENVSKQTGVSKEEAFTALSSMSLNAHQGVDSRRSILGKGVQLVVGAHGDVMSTMGGSSTSTDNSRHNLGSSVVLSSKEAEDFKSDLSHIMNYSESHHVDNNASQGSSAVMQFGKDLRYALNEQESYNSSMSESMKLAKAEQYADSHSSSISLNLNQEALAYGKHVLGEEKMDYLVSHPADIKANNELAGLMEQFVTYKKNEIIKESIGNTNEKELSSAYSAMENKVRDIKSNLNNQLSDLDSYPDSRLSNIKSTVDAKFTNHPNVKDKLTISSSKISNEKDTLKSSIENTHKNIDNNIQFGKTAAEQTAGQGAFNAVRTAPGKAYNFIKNTFKG